MSKCRYDLSTDCYNRDCLSCVLDKIRAKIMALRNIRAEEFDIDSDVFDDRVILRSDILKILDKYTAETEADND